MNSVLHSLVIPVFNEKDGITALYEETKKICDSVAAKGGLMEVIFVNDGSRDGSAQKLDEIIKKDGRYKVLHFSRNFGHQVAITAGIEHAAGATVSVMDADLQDPPEVILEFIAMWQKGYEVVYGVRSKRDGETIFKLLTAKVFYRIIAKLTNVEIPVDTGDFRLMDRKAVDALLSIKERHRFIRGLVSWVGFRQIGVEYHRKERKFGATHFPFKKMLKFAMDGITSFSSAPLQLAIWIGAISSFGALILSFWALYAHFYSDKTIQGWTSLILVVLFFGGCQLLAIGIIGEYIGRIYDEVKARPLYFVARKEGWK